MVFPPLGGVANRPELSGCSCPVTLSGTLWLLFRSLDEVNANAVQSVRYQLYARPFSVSTYCCLPNCLPFEPCVVLVYDTTGLQSRVFFFFFFFASLCRHYFIPIMSALPPAPKSGVGSSFIFVPSFLHSTYIL